MTQPKITIVTPSYNQGQFVERTIQSVLDQQYPNLEYIVMDGGSTDESVEVIKRYAKHFTYWISEKDGGQAEAINRGFSLSSGEILGWLNSDDRLEPGALDTVSEYAQRFTEAGAFVGHGRIVDSVGHELFYREPRDLSFPGFCNWLSAQGFSQPSCFFRRRAWELTGPFDETLDFAFDLDLWLRMVKHVTFHPIPALLSTALAHSSAKTTALRSRSVVEASFTIIRAGGTDFVRQPLEDMANRLIRYESIVAEIVDSPLARLVWPIVKAVFKPARRWRESLR